MIYHKDLDKITSEDIIELIDNSIPEEKHLDYKKTLPNFKDEKDTKEFCNDLISFANADGGLIIYGIEEERGVPKDVVGIEVDNFDELRGKIQSKAKDWIEPSLLNLNFKLLEVNSKYVLIIKIPKSWYGPHWVKKEEKFYTRTSHGKQPMSRDEIKVAFLSSETRAERIRKFITERVFMIYSNEFYYSLREGPKFIFHIIPINAFEMGNNLPLDKLFNNLKEYRLKIKSFPPFQRTNIDGLFFGDTLSGSVYLKYIQVFRNGVIEFCATNFFLTEKLWLDPVYENDIIEFLKTIIEVYKNIDVFPPIILFMSLVGVKNYVIYKNGASYYYLPDINYFDRDIIYVPEEIIESYDELPEKMLKPCFDAIWNACNFPRSHNYDDKGNWKGNIIR